MEHTTLLAAILAVFSAAILAGCLETWLCPAAAPFFDEQFLPAVLIQLGPA